jgi:hypothetical protein
MLSKTLDAAVKNIGFTVTPEHAYGIYGGFLITVYETGSKKTAFINFLLEDNPDDNSDASLSAFNISESIKENLYKYAIIDYNLSDDGLSVTTAGSAPEFLQMLDFCVELLDEHSNDNASVKNSNYCSCCGKSFGKRYPKKLTRSNKNYLLCESCALEILEEQDKHKQKTNEKIPASKRFAGVVGSVVGGLIGVFLYFAAYKWLFPQINTWDSFILNFVFALFGFATAFLAYLGYKIFCKKASLTAYISVSVVAVLFSVFGEYLGTIVKILADHESVSFGLVYKTVCMMPFRSTALKDALNYSSDFYTGAVMSFIFAAAGAVIFLLGLYEKSRGIKENIKIETIKIEN